MTTFISARRLGQLLGDRTPGGTAWRDLSERLRVLVVDGRLLHGTRLPSERSLTTELDLSRTTVARAYAELRGSGLIVSRRGSGSIVQVPFAASSVSSLIVTPGDLDTIAMTYAAPVAPAGLGGVFEAALTSLPSLLATTGYLPDGLPVLRERLAERYTARGLPTSPDQIVVTSGALSAISLIARAFVKPGDPVIVEGTSYPHAHDAFVSAGARLAPLAVGDDPWDEDALRSLAFSARHRLAYFIPDFHNPTSAIMTDRQRGRFARELNRNDVLTVIDESLRDTNIDDVRLPPSYGRYDSRALLVDSASKTIWGGLRVGWIRAPIDLVMPLVQARMTHDLGSAAFEQLVFAEILARDDTLTRSGLKNLRLQRDHLMTALADKLPDLDVPAAAGGLSLWVTLPEPMSTRLTAEAFHRGLLLTPGPRFFAAPVSAGERHLRLPYTHAPEVLSEAVDRLADAYAARMNDERPRADAIDLIA